MAKLNLGNLKPLGLAQAQIQVMSGEVSDEFTAWWKETMPDADPNHSITAKAVAWCAWCGSARAILIGLRDIKLTLK